MCRQLVLAVVASALVALTPGGASAQGPASSPQPSVGPSSSATVAGSAAPGASGVPATSADLTCEDLAGLLPAAFDSWPVDWTAAEGVAEPIPGYPVAGLIATLGVPLDAVCVVRFDYGPNAKGVMTRFSGAEPAGLLDAYLADAKATASANGIEIRSAPFELGGRPGMLFSRPKDGTPFSAFGYQMGNVIVEMTDRTAADAVVAYLPEPGAPLPAVTPPPPAPTEPPTGRADCSKVYSLLPQSAQSAGATGISSIGPDAIAGRGFDSFTAPPATMSSALLGQFGINVWAVCRMDFTFGTGNLSQGRFWKLGKGGAATLQPYLDDMIATITATGGTATQATEKIGKRTVTTLTVTLPSGTTTYYYTPTGKAIAEFATREDAQRMMPLLPKASKG